MTMDIEIETGNLVINTLYALRNTSEAIEHHITHCPEEAFKDITRSGIKKAMLSIDSYAELIFRDDLFKRLPAYTEYLKIIGEESLSNPQLDLSAEHKHVALVDIVDGTDLLERRLSNWCSAVIIYSPTKKLIVASFVLRPDDGLIYYARHDREGAYKCYLDDLKQETKAERLPLRKLPVDGPSYITTISDASVAFYGQKLNNFLSIASSKKFISYIKKATQNAARKKLPKPKTRIYNLAGNPMMIRMIDGQKKIDAVFDLEGQAPHDVAPGAYIAQKAGAFFCDIEGRPINLEEILLRPAKSRIKYFLTSTPELSEELRSLFK